MPCSDGGPRYVDCEDESKLKEARATLRKQQDKLDKYARLLCFVCANLEPEDLNRLYLLPKTEDHGKAGDELKAWWAAHQDADQKEAARKAKENAKAQARFAEEARKAKVITEALRKLSSEERQLLGLT